MDGVAAQRVPTLVMWGDTGQDLPVRPPCRRRQRCCPHARTHAFRDTGHMPQIERAEEFADLITGFWADAPVRLAPRQLKVPRNPYRATAAG